MKSIILFCIHFLVIDFLLSQSILLPIPENQSIQDIQHQPTGYMILNISDHVLPSNRHGLMIAHTDHYNTFMESSINNIYHPDINFWTGRLAIGPIEFFDVPIVSHYSVAAKFSSSVFQDERALITNIDNLGTEGSYIRWSKRNTNFKVVSAPLVLHLSGGDYLFIYNYDAGGNVFKVSASRISYNGIVLWEKTYDMNRDRGEEYTMLYISTAKILSNGNIALGGYIRKSLSPGLRPIPFLYVIDQNGRVEWSTSFAKRAESNFSEIIDIVQNASAPNEFLFVGNEGPLSGHSNIYVGKMSVSGTMISHKYVEFPEIDAGDYLVSQSADIIESENILGISGLRRQSGIDKNFYLRYNINTASFDYYNELKDDILPGIIIRNSEYSGLRFLVGFNNKSSTITDIKLKRINLSGEEPVCDPTSVFAQFTPGEFGPPSAKRVKARNFNNLEPIEVQRSFTSHLPEYCNTASMARSIKEPLKSSIHSTQISNESWQFYPNPALSEVNIISKLKINTISIYDLQGRLVQNISGNGSSNQKITLHAMSSGMYTIAIQTDQGKGVKKLVIK